MSARDFHTTEETDVAPLSYPPFAGDVAPLATDWLSAGKSLAAADAQFEKNEVSDSDAQVVAAERCGEASSSVRSTAQDVELYRDLPALIEPSGIRLMRSSIKG
eukprot:934200-Pyramimonas_sp.AAC.1